MAFGHIPNYPVGSTFEDRRDLHDAGVHRPPQAGICGSEKAGAESVVLSGGYVDDEDYGDVIIYTGHGGQDEPRGPQVRDQTLTLGNRALATSYHTGRPVRVVRGAAADYHGTEPDWRPPAAGYRYDGLYRVEQYWPEVGRDGHKVWRFRLVRLSEEEQGGRVVEERAPYEAVPRRDERARRVVRDAGLAERVKRLHRYHCQICGERIETPAGPYAEAAHVRPLGRPHDGPDTLDNLLCLCPNCHVRFDEYAVAVEDGFRLIGAAGHLRRHRQHRLDLAHLRYHRTLFELAMEERSVGALRRSRTG
ncbi:MAG: YDG/SRA domain-containing protein [Rhodothermales bacterium]|nr:YDG/SRA domain-containing protein [Rhodothermales bacterium]